MPSKKIDRKAAERSTPKKPSAAGSTTSARSTVSGPARPDGVPSDAATRKADGAQALAEEMPFNPNKAGEYGKASASRGPGLKSTSKILEPRPAR